MSKESERIAFQNAEALNFKGPVRLNSLKTLLDPALDVFL